MADPTPESEEKLRLFMESEFAQLLADNNLSKGKFAKLLGVSSNTVSNWGFTPPKYATEFLKMRLAMAKCKALVKKLTVI